MPLDYKRQPIQALESDSEGNCPLMLSWLLWTLDLLFAILAVVFSEYLLDHSVSGMQG